MKADKTQPKPVSSVEFERRYIMTPELFRKLLIAGAAIAALASSPPPLKEERG